MTPTPPSGSSGAPPPDDIDWDVVPPPPTSAFDRIQTRTVEVARSSRRRLPRKSWTAWLVAAMVAIVLITAAITWWLRRDAPDSDRDLLVSFTATAEDYRPSFLTSDDGEAEAYVDEVFGWPIGVPEVPGMALVGVGEAALSPRLSVPAFRYIDPDEDVAVVFAFDYVFLGQAEGTLDLPEATYSQLAEPVPVDTRRLGGAYLVTWRERAVVYTAVTESEDVFERLGRSVREANGPAAGPGDKAGAGAGAEAVPPAAAAPAE